MKGPAILIARRGGTTKLLGELAIIRAPGVFSVKPDECIHDILVQNALVCLLTQRFECRPQIIRVGSIGASCNERIKHIDYTDNLHDWV